MVHDCPNQAPETSEAFPPFCLEPYEDMASLF